MAKIILRTNIANRNFSVEHKVLQTPITEEVIELLITPKVGLNIKANKFNTGYLPIEINRIEYVNFGNNVIAKVYLNPNIETDVDLNILLPISGVATTVSDSFTLISRSSINENIITNEFSTFGKSTNGTTSTYNVNSGAGKTVLVLRKSLVAPNGTYFTTAPTHTVSGNASRYKINSKIRKNENGDIIYSTIEVYYTSPKEIISVGAIDTISFAAELSAPRIEVKDIVATEQKDYKIYSINTGRDINVLGGTKRVVIKGVPGTPFKIIASNSSNESYNFTTGAFGTTGGMFNGVIPPPVKGRSFGVYHLPIKVPRGADTIKTSLISDELVDHSLIKDALIQANVTTSSTETTDPVSMTITFVSSGFDLPYTLSTADSTHFVVGPGVYKTTDADAYTFDVQGLTGDGAADMIEIIRQPRHSQIDAYVNWDSGDATKEVDSAGTAINNDWSNVTDNKNWRYKISTTVSGVGTKNEDGLYREVRITGTVSGIQYGDGDINPQLDLLNFITIHS